MGIVIPAIDLLGGKAVRLYKGNYNRVTIYSENPVELAKKFVKMGAKLLHIIDLDGARSGDNLNFNTIEEIAKITPIEVGGGIRDQKIVEKYLNFAKRVILGTVAISDSSFVEKMIDLYGKEKILVSIDVKDGKVSINGWVERTEIDYLDFIKELSVEIVIVTDISKDGTLAGPNWQVYEKIKNKKVIVSGGVASDEDIIKAEKYEGVIVGKAYYEGQVNLERFLMPI